MEIINQNPYLCFWFALFICWRFSSVIINFINRNKSIYWCDCCVPENEEDDPLSDIEESENEKSESMP